MKRLLALLLLATSPLVAQQEEIQSEAVRAFQAGDFATAKSLFQSLLQIDPKNPAARNYLRAIALRESGGPGLEASLRSINIAAVDFRDVTVREAVAFVAQKVQEISAGKRSVNVVWMVPPETTEGTRITLSLRNVPASEVLRYISDASNLRFTYDAHALKIRPMSKPSGEAASE
ncbi:MAG TPA: tetratricopeptide repeat protein [Terrimicrobiaceae bacterium]|nr:tetratricopeptide repeat protein [Terrimicrobiaceae bacterium]